MPRVRRKQPKMTKEQRVAHRAALKAMLSKEEIAQRKATRAARHTRYKATRRAKREQEEKEKKAAFLSLMKQNPRRSARLNPPNTEAQLDTGAQLNTETQHTTGANSISLPHNRRDSNTEASSVVSSIEQNQREEAPSPRQSSHMSDDQDAMDVDEENDRVVVKQEAVEVQLPIREYPQRHQNDRVIVKREVVEAQQPLPGNYQRYQPLSAPRSPPAAPRSHMQYKQQQSTTLLDALNPSTFVDGATDAYLEELVGLGPDFCKGLLDFYVFFPREKKAVCSNKDAISDRGLIAFLKHCPNLQQLSLIRSPNITDVSLYPIFQHCKKLECLNLSASLKDLEKNLGRCDAVELLAHDHDICPKLRKLTLHNWPLLRDDVAKNVTANRAELEVETGMRVSRYKRCDAKIFWDGVEVLADRPARLGRKSEAIDGA